LLEVIRGSIGVRQFRVEFRGQHDAPAVLPGEETPIEYRLSGRFVEERNLSLLQEFEPCTVQPVA
jgi:hypothetical protein